MSIFVGMKVYMPKAYDITPSARKVVPALNGVFGATAPKSAVFILNTCGLPDQFGRFTPSGTGTV